MAKEKSEIQVEKEPLGTLLLTLNDTSEVRGEVNEFEGVKYLHLRKWFYSTKQQGWMRGKGLSVPKDGARELVTNLSAWVLKR